MHRFRNTIATTHFRHKGSRKTDNKLSALLYSTVHPDPLLTQDFWGDLERHKAKQTNKNQHFLLQLDPLRGRVLPRAACGDKLRSANSSALLAFSLPFCLVFGVTQLQIQLSWNHHFKPSHAKQSQTQSLKTMLSTTTESNTGHSVFHLDLFRQTWHWIHLPTTLLLKMLPWIAEGAVFVMVCQIYT